ncbi:MAG: hypothetical protein ABII82_04080 [Verrucomicrobiota bacterium]
MKHTALRILSIITLLAAPLPAHENNVGGPNGGRLLTGVEPHAEFLVTPERKVQVTFVGEDGKPVAPSTQSVQVTAGERSAPVTLKLVRDGDALVSEGVLPAGNDYPTVVVIKPAADAKPVVARFNLNTTICPGCDLPEYACTCGH